MYYSVYRKTIFLISFFVIGIQGCAFANCDQHQEVPVIYSAIKTAIDKQYRNGNYQKNYETAKIFTGEVFVKTAVAFVETMERRLQQGSWLQGGTQDYLFVRKLVLPAGSEIEFRGDLHGDARSLIRWLDDLQAREILDKDNIFKLVKQNHYLAFLGDYTDRGHYGAEVMYIIMQLFLHNPNNILIVRGNHEDLKLASTFGFATELREKNFNTAIAHLSEVYDTLPIALFLGCVNMETNGVDFVLCCHGGIEPLYNSKPLLEDFREDLYEWFDKKIQTARETVPCELHHDISKLLEESSCNCQHELFENNGFLWNDFDFFNNAPHDTWYYKAGRGRVLHKKLTTMILKNAGGKNRLCAVFRAHQHNSKTVPHILQYGNGVYKLWSEKTTKVADFGNKKGTGNLQWSGIHCEPVPLEKYSVWTFNVAPRTGVYEHYVPKHFTYDTVARLKLGPGFDTWVLQPRKIRVD